MRIGVVSEGPADFAVVRNVIKGALGLDGSDVDSIRPELNSDETDLNAPGARSFSNWQIVRDECASGVVIAEHLGEWLTGRAVDRIVFAIAVEETDAWLLPVYAVNMHGDTGAVVDPKKRLIERELPRTNMLSDRERARILALRKELDRYHPLSQPLRKSKALLEASARNASLDAFVRDLRALAQRIDPTLP